MNRFQREEIWHWFTNNNHPCGRGLGNKIRNCQDFKDKMKKELSGPGCTSCRMKAVYKKYKALVTQNIIFDDE